MIGLALRMRPGLANAVCEAGHGDSGGVSQGDQDQGQRRPPWADGVAVPLTPRLPAAITLPWGERTVLSLDLGRGETQERCGGAGGGAQGWGPLR